MTCLSASYIYINVSHKICICIFRCFVHRGGVITVEADATGSLHSSDNVRFGHEL